MCQQVPLEPGAGRQALQTSMRARSFAFPSVSAQPPSPSLQASGVPFIPCHLHWKDYFLFVFFVFCFLFFFFGF